MRFSLLFLTLILPLFSACAPAKKEAGKNAPLALFSVPAGAPTIVLDPGHGGTDHGARAKMPYCEEKRLSLQTARLVKQYLDQLGYHVVMTRTSDAYISLQRRVEIAHQSGCDVFVSLHFNSSPNPKAHGIEIFFSEAKDKGMKGGYSKRLATAILGRMVRQTMAQSRGVKKGNFYVIRETEIPAVLVEAGFLSNAKERSLLKSREYQEKIARGIADGIDAYFKKVRR